MILCWGGVDGCFEYNFTFIVGETLKARSLITFGEVERVPLFSKESLLERIECGDW